MYCVANNVMVVGKSKFRTKEGDMFCKLTLTNGSGELVEVTCDETSWERFVPLDMRYDLEIDYHNVGYKIYADVVSASEC